MDTGRLAEVEAPGGKRNIGLSEFVEQECCKELKELKRCHPLGDITHLGDGFTLNSQQID